MDLELDSESVNGSSGMDLMRERQDTVSNDQMEVLERLSKNGEIRVKNQLMTESDLTNEEKLDVLRDLLVKSPLQFLTRFGKRLEVQELPCFAQFEDPSVVLYLAQLKKELTDAKILFKNRRYAALQKLVDTTDYFTEEEMQRRNPILYDQLIGKFQTKEEKQAFLKRSYDAAASSKTPLTDLLMAHMNRNEQGESYRRLDQEKQQAEEEEAEAEYQRIDDDDDQDDEMEIGGPSSRRNNADGNDEEGEEIEDEEKELFKEEFYTTMYQHFLDGKDIDFDYSTVDNNEEYDVGENLELDAEEKYFDGEEPFEAMGETQDNNEISDDLFNPPVRCKDIESKIKSLSVDTHSKPLISVTTNHNNDEDEGEDELDVYMKSIEKELQNQS